MLFKRTEDLKNGMRLARPIYNKNGVLLFERDSKLTQQGIESIKNFGLIGIFILEPAEPVPPMTEEDLEFERFQTIHVFAIKEELERISLNGKSARLQIIVSTIIKNYGHRDKKLNFIQNLRSVEDYTYKHTLNVSILCAIMSNQLNMKVEERLDVVMASILYTLNDYVLIDKVCTANPNVKRICIQYDKITEAIESGVIDSGTKFVAGAKILAAAKIFDTMTAMNMERQPESEVAALKYLIRNQKYYSKQVIEALINSVNILVPGVCVELNTGEKALVLTENQSNILRPMILTFKKNTIIDLSNLYTYGDLEIKDIMKTMDNRYIMDIEMLKKQGYKAEEPVYVREWGESRGEQHADN